MDEYKDTTLHNAEGTEDALRADMNDNAAPETGNAAETELLSAVADIERRKKTARRMTPIPVKRRASPAPSGTVETIAGGTSPSPA